MTAESLASDLEAERFSRYGLSQPEMRKACDVIRAVAESRGIRRRCDLAMLLKAIILYPDLDCHADKERTRCKSYAPSAI